MWKKHHQHLIIFLRCSWLFFHVFIYVCLFICFCLSLTNTHALSRPIKILFLLCTSKNGHLTSLMPSPGHKSSSEEETAACSLLMRNKSKTTAVRSFLPGNPECKAGVFVSFCSCCQGNQSQQAVEQAAASVDRCSRVESHQPPHFPFSWGLLVEFPTLLVKFGILEKIFSLARRTQ